MVCQNPKAAGGAPKFIREIIKHSVVSRAVRSQSLLPSSILRDLINPLIPDIDIQDLPLPMQIATVDLHSGERVILQSGSLRRAIRASMSIPGVFPAVHHNGQLLSDIGSFDLVPTDISSDATKLKGVSEATIACDVGQQIDERTKCKSALDVFLRSQFLGEQTLRKISLARADYVVRPNLRNSEWFDFSDPSSIIQAGYQAGKDLFATSEPGVVNCKRIHEHPQAIPATK